MKTTTTILVVEDEPAIQSLILLNLKHAGFRVVQAFSAEEASVLINAELPDLLLLDWMLPGQSGVALAKKIRATERSKELPIIFLTARAHEEDKVEGLEVGADDYISKPFSPKELVARIRALLRRRTPHLDENIVCVGSLTLNPLTHRVSLKLNAALAEKEAPTLELGPTEFRLLHFFMTHLERAYTRTQLLNEVWGDHVFIDERTVDVHIRRLRSALEGSGHDTRIETVRGTGYRFRGEES